jgi:hypothetical protein
MTQCSMDVYHRAKAGSSDAFQFVVDSWKPWMLITLHRVRQHSSLHQQLLEVEELWNEALHGLHHAVTHLNESFEAPQCQSYIRMTIRFALWRYAEQQLKHRMACQSDVLENTMNRKSLCESIHQLDALIQEETHTALKRVVRKYCTPDEQDYLFQRFGMTQDPNSPLSAQNVLKDVQDSMQSLRRLAHLFGVSYQALQRKERRLLKRLRHLLTRHHLKD